ncbi:MAG: hypothetical protein L0Y80_00115 [Ignavibacteriae bacterium]|nr:hypothetical protein [Ignavibacteriota bacterium]
MSDRVRKYLSVLSLVLFLSGFAFADIGHSHFVSAEFNSTTSFQSHDCQDKEQHKPLDVRFHCVQSCRVLGLSHALAPDSFRLNISFEFVVLNDSQDGLSAPSLLNESKRGPPRIS